jgi:hypothetical protein
VEPRYRATSRDPPITVRPILAKIGTAAQGTFLEMASLRPGSKDGPGTLPSPSIERWHQLRRSDGRLTLSGIPDRLGCPDVTAAS